jgi:hypothetical protein
MRNPEPDALTALRQKLGDSAIDDLLERICLLPDEQYPRDGFSLVTIYQHNAINHTMTGFVEVGGEEYEFIVHNGDWAGTVVEAFSADEAIHPYEPPTPDPMTLIPRDRFSATAWKVRDAIIERADIVEKIRGYNYDRHFAPGHKTESYYRAWAEKMGGGWAHESEVAEMRERAKSAPTPAEVAAFVAAWEQM